MTVQELIDALQKLPKDLKVYAYTDHGQTPEGICSPSIAWFDEDSIEFWTNSEEEAEEEGYTYKGVLL